MSTETIENSAPKHGKSKKSQLKKRAGITALGITLAHALVLGGAGLGLASCAHNASKENADTEKSNADKLAVSASFYPIVWLTEHIGGEAVEVSSVTPTNVEPHDFELSPKDADSLSQANLVLYVEGFQPSLDDAVATIDGINAVNLADAVNLVKADPSVAEHEHHHHHGEEDAAHAHEHDDEHAEDAAHEHTEADHDGAEHAEEAEHAHEGADHDHDHGELGLDPHFWLDPERMESAAKEITHALENASPEHKAEFNKNLETLTASLDKLDASFENGLKQCKLDTFVTSHSAFSYLAERYGLTQASISGVDPETEPSPADLAAVKEIVSQTGTTTIFTEELVSPKVAEALAHETGASTAVLSPLESQPESGDYVSAMTANLTALQQALQCE